MPRCCGRRQKTRRRGRWRLHLTVYLTGDVASETPDVDGPAQPGNTQAAVRPHFPGRPADRALLGRVGPCRRGSFRPSARPAAGEVAAGRPAQAGGRGRGVPDATAGTFRPETWHRRHSPCVSGRARPSGSAEPAHLVGAGRLPGDDQGIAVEDLSVAGLARTKLTKSVHDAGWPSFLSMLEYKAERYGRTLVRIGRFTPTSQTCSRPRGSCRSSRDADPWGSPDRVAVTPY